MSRAFAPPDTLSPDDRKTVADVRRAVWINGLFGLGAGAAAGTLGHVVLKTLQTKIVGDAAGSSEATAAAGKASEAGWIRNSFRQLPPLGKNTFMLCLLGGGALGSFVMSTTAGKNAVHLLHPIFDAGRDEHAGKSPYQIAVAEDLKQGGDDATTDSANGGDRAKVWGRRQTQRRRVIQERIEKGNALSDSTGGQWSKENDGKN